MARSPVEVMYMRCIFGVRSKMERDNKTPLKMRDGEHWVKRVPIGI